MTPEQKIEMLEGLRLEAFADLHRHHAECEAQAIASANHPDLQRLVTSCFETYATMVAQSQRHMADIDKRIEEIQLEKMKAFNGKPDDAK